MRFSLEFCAEELVVFIKRSGATLSPPSKTVWMLTHSHSDGEFPIYNQGEVTFDCIIAIRDVSILF